LSLESAAVLLGLILGAGLAFTKWTSSLAVGTLATSGLSTVVSFTQDKISAVRDLLQNMTIMWPVILGLNTFLVTFISTLVFGATIVFARNFYTLQRVGNPEAWAIAGQKAATLFSTGIHAYLSFDPAASIGAERQRLEKYNDVRDLFLKTLSKEIPRGSHNPEHFKDSVDALGRIVLQTIFDAGPDLQKYRMAFFLLNNDRTKLDYCVAIDNGDWTAHSLTGFTVATSFMGEALRRNQPMVYPRDKKKKVPFEERKSAGFKSFVAIPVPCSEDKNIGVITVDYTGGQEVFTEGRIEILFGLCQVVYSLYSLNIGRTGNG
jgi:hypothetical protein